MRFYRRLTKFKAICFDLDDTLYPNRQVMLATEKSMVAFFDDLLSPLDASNTHYDRHFWWPFRQKVIANNEALSHDVTALRKETYFLGIFSLTKDDALARKLAEQALSYFMVKRSEFVVPDDVHKLLSQLAQKYPLVAISNGNVNTDAIGISQYFSHILMAGKGNNKKPDRDMFAQAADLLGLPVAQLLHVGDCGHADVFGALRSGMQSVWLSCYDVGKPIRTLPHVEITEFAQLEQLV